MADSEGYSEVPTPTPTPPKTATGQAQRDLDLGQFVSNLDTPDLRRVKSSLRFSHIKFNSSYIFHEDCCHSHFLIHF